MVEMINRMTGTPMLVAEDRLPEYLQMGHRIAKKTVKVETKKTPEKKPVEKAVDVTVDERKVVDKTVDETPVKVKTGRGRAKKK